MAHARTFAGTECSCPTALSQRRIRSSDAGDGVLEYGTACLSVSVEIVTIRDDFSERGCVRCTSRSASEPPEAPVSLQAFVPFLPAAAGPADTAALLWLRLRRAA